MKIGHVLGKWYAVYIVMYASTYSWTCRKNIGVASYGAQGHDVPPQLLFNFGGGGHLTAAQTLTFDFMWLPMQ